MAFVNKIKICTFNLIHYNLDTWYNKTTCNNYISPSSLIINYWFSNNYTTLFIMQILNETKTYTRILWFKYLSRTANTYMVFMRLLTCFYLSSNFTCSHCELWIFYGCKIIIFHLCHRIIFLLRDYFTNGFYQIL